MATGETTGPAQQSRIRWLDTEGHRVLLVDLSYYSGVRIANVIRDAGQVIRAQPLASTLVLRDFTGVGLDSDLVVLFKEVAPLDQPHIKRSAWVGTESLSQLWHAAIEQVSKLTFQRFETREKALRFLVCGAGSLSQSS